MTEFVTSVFGGPCLVGHTPHFCSAISNLQPFRKGMKILLTRDDSRLDLNDSSEYSTCQLDLNARGYSGHVVVLRCWWSAQPWESPWCPQIPWYSRFEICHIYMHTFNSTRNWNRAMTPSTNIWVSVHSRGIGLRNVSNSTQAQNLMPCIIIMLSIIQLCLEAD